MRQSFQNWPKRQHSASLYTRNTPTWLTTSQLRCTDQDLRRLEFDDQCCFLQAYVCNHVLDQPDIDLYRSDCWIVISVVSLFSNCQLSYVRRQLFKKCPHRQHKYGLDECRTPKGLISHSRCTGRGLPRVKFEDLWHTFKAIVFNGVFDERCIYI